MYFHPVLTNKDFLLSYECILCLEFCGSGERTQVLTHTMHSTTELHSQLNIYDLKSMHPINVKSSAVDLIS